MTQREQIKQHLTLEGTITPIQAMREYGIMRLAARIHELRADGLPITTEDPDGDATYAIYTLETEGL